MRKPQIDFVFEFRSTRCDDATWHRDRRSFSSDTSTEQMLQDVGSGEGWEVRQVGLEWPAHTDLGGYPLFYTTQDNGVLSPEAANENLALTLGDDPQWRIVSQDINYEDDHLLCEHSGLPIPSAYGEPSHA